MQVFKSAFSPQQQQPDPDGPGWFFTTLTRAVGSFAGLVGIICGIMTMLSISFSCIFAGGLIAIEGLIVTLIEAPCFCVFLDFSQYPSSFFGGKPAWTRATLYLFFGVLPFMFCTGFTEIFACVLYIITSACYLMQSLGRKASFEEMRANAAQQVQTAPEAVLVHNEVPVATSKPGFFSGGPTIAPSSTQTKNESGLTGVVY